MTNDLISRQAAIDAFYQYPNVTWTTLDVMEKINELPPAQPKRIRGKWTMKDGGLAFWDVCSECGKIVMHRAPFYNFCPNCGADMREEDT